MKLDLKITDVLIDEEDSSWSYCGNCMSSMPLCAYCGVSYFPENVVFCEQNEELHFCSEECAEYFNEQYEEEGEVYL